MDKARRESKRDFWARMEREGRTEEARAAESEMLAKGMYCSSMQVQLVRNFQPLDGSATRAWTTPNSWEHGRQYWKKPGPSTNALFLDGLVWASGNAGRDPCEAPTAVAKMLAELGQTKPQALANIFVKHMKEIRSMEEARLRDKQRKVPRSADDEDWDDDFEEDDLDDEEGYDKADVDRAYWRGMEEGRRTAEAKYKLASVQQTPSLAAQVQVEPPAEPSPVPPAVAPKEVRPVPKKKRKPAKAPKPSAGPPPLILCSTCKPRGYAVCQDCVMANNPDTIKVNGTLFRVRPEQAAAYKKGLPVQGL